VERVIEERELGQELYPTLLARDWNKLPEAVRRLHVPRPVLVAEGMFRVTHGRSWLASLVIAMFRLPPAGEQVPLRLVIEALEARQRWDRTFDGTHTMITYQYLLPDGRLGERTGPLELLFRVEVERAAIHYHPVGLRLCIGRWRLPLPAWCGPRVTARLWAAPDATEMNVMVYIRVPLLGELVTYGGPLAPT